MKSSRKTLLGTLMFFVVLFSLVFGYLAMRAQYNPENLSKDLVWHSITSPTNDPQVRCFVSIKLSFASTLCTRNWSDTSAQTPIEVEWLTTDPPEGVVGECLGFHIHLSNGVKSVPVSGTWCN